MLRRGGGPLRLVVVAVVALGMGWVVGAMAARPLVGGVAVQGAARASRLSFRHMAPFLIVIQRNDGKNWVNIQSAKCWFSQAGVPSPKAWQWTAGDASIHQNPKFVTLRFRAERASSAMTLVSGTLMLEITDSVNGMVDTQGTTINVDEVLIDPCPPAKALPVGLEPEKERIDEGSGGEGR